MKMLKAGDVATVCNVSLSKAYQIMRALNAELEKAGYLTIPGRIPDTYLYKRIVPEVPEVVR